jgi:RHS repeat-associated protein
VTHYRYEQLGSKTTHRFEKLISPSGKQPVIYHYDADGRLISVEDAFHRTITLERVDGVREEVITDRLGGVSVYEYDTRGNVTRTENPIGEVTTYHYGYEFGDPNPDAQIETITPAGIKTFNQNRYDSTGLLDRTVTQTLAEVDGVWTEVAPRSITLFDSSTGRQLITLSASTAGQATSNTYNSAGNLTSTATYACTIDLATNIVTLGEQFSKTTFDTYDRGNPTSVTQHIRTAPGVFAPYLVSRSVYDSRGYLTESRTEKPDGTWLSRTTYTPDSMGNVTRTAQWKKNTAGVWVEYAVNTATYDSLGRPTHSYSPDALSGTLHTQTLYNPDGQVFKSIDARGNYTETDYDPAGQAIASRSYAAGGTLLSSTSTAYNANGQAITSTDALGNNTHSYYDIAGRSVRTISPDSTSSETLYDAAGRAYVSIDRHLSTQTTGLRGTLSVYDNAGRVIESRRLDNLTITISELDALNHILTVGLILPEGVATPADLPYLSRSQTHYNALGQVDYTISATGQRTEYLYDDAGRQWKTIQIDVPVWNPTTGQNVATDLTTTTEFDGLGRAYRSIDANGHATETVYDDTGRVDRTVFHDGSFVAYGYDSLGRKVWQSDQLPAGSTQAAIDASKTSYEYDDSWNLTDVYLPAITDNKPGSPTFGQAVSPHWHYVYDRNGQQTAQTDPYGHTTSFAYDPLTGQELTRTLPLGQQEESRYDSLGRPTVQIDFAGRVSESVYDGDERVPVEQRNNLGRIAQRRYHTSEAAYDNGAGTPDRTVSYIYDELGRTVQTGDSETGVTSYQYDAEGQQTQIASHQGTINHGYDPVGRMNRTWTASTDARYSYDPLGRLSTVTMATRQGAAVPGASLDWYGQMISGETTRYFYDTVGNVDLIRQSNGIASDYEYDTLYRLTDLTHFEDTDGDFALDAGEDVAGEFHYSLNADGSRSSAVEVDDQGIQRTFYWMYDADDRLVSEVLDSSDDAQDYITLYTMDLTGNRLSVQTDNAATSAAIADFLSTGALAADQVISYQYDANDRLLSETNDAEGSAEDRHTVYQYGPGNALTEQTSKTVHAGLDDTGAVTEQTTFQYNVQGRTATITVSKDVTVTQIAYTYNDAGIRVSEATTVDGVTTMRTYLIDPNNFTGYAQVLEESVSGVLARTFTIGHDVVTQHDAANGPLTLLYDGHGSTRALTDAVDDVLQRYVYKAYGELLAGAGLTATVEAALTSFLYSGEMTDKLTGLQNLRARLYDVSTGRFTQFDTYRGNTADPASLHKYLYANANAVNGIDPSGKWTKAEVLVVFTLTGALVGMLLGAAIAVHKRYKLTQWQFWAWTLGGAIVGAGVGYLGGLALIKLGLIAIASGGPLVPSLRQAADRGYASHPDLVEGWKNQLGAWSGNASLQIHHFVGQQWANIQRYGERTIHSLRNSTPIPVEYHRPITNMYNSGPGLLEFMARDPGMSRYGTLHEWMATQPWDVQWRWGYYVYWHVIQYGTLAGFDPAKYGL